MRSDRHKYLCVMVVVTGLEAARITHAADLTPAGAVQSTASVLQAVAVPAQWAAFNILVDFQNLPRTYSCDELWYKFRDVLRKVGARADVAITPYACGYLGGGEARSPRVEVKFQMPRLLHGAETRYAEISVLQKEVVLAPGSPVSFAAHDCELARQLDSLFFPPLPIRVQTADFRCADTQPSYKVVISAEIVASSAPAPSPQS
jgi:hypothetical protein